MSFQSFTAKSRQQNRGREQNRGRDNRNRSKPIPRSKPEYIPLRERATHQVVGSGEWGLYQRQQSILEGRETPNYISETPTVKQSQKNTVGIQNRNAKNFKENWTSFQKHKQSQLIDQIVDYTNGNDWSQITGGEHDKKWINPRYGEKVFDSGRIVEKATGDVIYFPISNLDDDPEGIAMHYRVSADGSSCTIYHNGFIKYGNARDRKYWNYMKERKARMRVEKEKNNAIEAESLRQERLVKYWRELMRKREIVIM